MKKKLLAPILILASCTMSCAQDMFIVTPTFHINFGNADRVHCSYGFEVAYWHLDDFYHSVDVGMEFQHKKLRLYSELQTGIWFTGISLGPVIEFSRLEHEAHLGFQTSIWASNFIGIDYRRRWIGGRKDHALGLMINKYPIPLPEFDPGLDDDLNLGDSSSEPDDDYDHDWDWD